MKFKANRDLGPLLIEKIRYGNINSFNILFNKLYPIICSFSNKYLKNPHEAEDVTQEIFIKVWNQREKFESVEQIKAFLYLSAKNKCLNIIKHFDVKEKHKREYIPVLDIESSFEENVIRAEVIAYIKNSIDKLPAQRKKIIILSMNGLKNKEIAEELNISVNTVKLQKKIAYEKLKNIFKDTIFSFLFF